MAGKTLYSNICLPTRPVHVGSIESVAACRQFTRHFCGQLKNMQIWSEWRTFTVGAIIFETLFTSDSLLVNSLKDHSVKIDFFKIILEIKMEKPKERHWRFQRQSVVTLTDEDKTSGGGWEDWGSAKSRWGGRVENNTRRICLRNALPNSVSIGGKYFQQEEDWSLHIKASQLATRTNKLVFPDPKNVRGVNSLAITSSFPG